MLDGCSLDAFLQSVPDVVMQSIVHVESANNPYAIGVVGDRLVRQPRTLQEATATAKRLQQLGRNFSVGLAQVNLSNLPKMGITSWPAAFDRCTNLGAGARIFSECYGRSGSSIGKALSCYYSGNFVTGYSHGYVQKVLARLNQLAPSKAGMPPQIAGKISEKYQSGLRVASELNDRIATILDGTQTELSKTFKSDGKSGEFFGSAPKANIGSGGTQRDPLFVF